MFKGDYTIRAVDSELWDAIQAENEPQSTDIVDRLRDVLHWGHGASAEQYGAAE
jgi:hypothetical protein